MLQQVVKVRMKDYEFGGGFFKCGSIFGFVLITAMTSVNQIGQLVRPLAARG